MCRRIRNMFYMSDNGSDSRFADSALRVQCEQSIKTYE